MTLRLCPRRRRAPLPPKASLGAAPCARGAGDALPWWDAACCIPPGWLVPGMRSGSPSLPSPLLPCSEGSGLSWSWILSLSARKIESILFAAGLAVPEPGAQRLCSETSASDFFLCWDVSPGSQISCSSAFPAASPSHADPRGSHGWLGAACWPRSPEAQHGTEPSGAGHVRVPLLAAWKNLAPLERGRGGGFPAEIAPALGRRMPRPCQRFFLLVRSHSPGAESREMHACKNQCEGINQAESERLKKSRGSGVMCVIERGFLYLRGPPRLLSCQGKPAKAETFCTPKQIMVCRTGTLRASCASRRVNTFCFTVCSPRAAAVVFIGCPGSSGGAPQPFDPVVGSRSGARGGQMR